MYAPKYTKLQKNAFFRFFLPKIEISSFKDSEAQKTRSKEHTKFAAKTKPESKLNKIAEKNKNPEFWPQERSPGSAKKSPFLRIGAILRNLFCEKTDFLNYLINFYEFIF